MSPLNLSSDRVIGRLQEDSLRAQVSLRGGVIVLQLARMDSQKGIEVSFSPKALQQLVDILQEAIRLAPGRELQ